MLQLQTSRGGAHWTLSQPRPVSPQADSLKRRRAAAVVHYSARAEDKFAAAANAPAEALALPPERSVDAMLGFEMERVRLGFVLGCCSSRWLTPAPLRRGNFFS